jgi:hypothetical protein
VTAIKLISSSRRYILAFLILTGLLYIVHWYQNPALDNNIVIIVSALGYLNNKISLKWLYYFNKYI